MSKAKVAPEPAPTSEPVSDAKMPKAALLRRLMEIENTIQNITASKTLDGYKSLPLHTAARRGDMREVASLLPTHHTSLSLRDESGWMPIHHAATAGRRIIFRVPLNEPKMVDLASCEAVAEDLCKLIEAATIAVGEAEEVAEATGHAPVEISFSEQMERALDGYLADKPGEGGSGASSTGPSQPAAAELPPPKASEGKSPGRRGKKGGVQIAEPPAAAPPRSTESLARKVEAAAMSQLREELPVGVWIEVKYLPPARDGVDQGPVPPATPHPNATALPAGTTQAFLQIMLLELHDSEFDSESMVKQGRNSGSGRLLDKAPLDVAMSAVARGLSIWEPTRENLDEIFQIPDPEADLDPAAILKKSLLVKPALSGLAQRSVLRLSGIAIDGEKLTAGGVNFKDFFVRANLVMRDERVKGMTEEEDEVPGPLKVEPNVTAKTTTRPKPSSLDWGSEAITLEFPGPVQLPAFVQLLVRAKDSKDNSGQVLGHALVVLDNINGQVSVQLQEAEESPSPPPSPPGGSSPAISPPSSPRPGSPHHHYHHHQQQLLPPLALMPPLPGMSDLSDEDAFQMAWHAHQRPPPPPIGAIYPSPPPSPPERGFSAPPGRAALMAAMAEEDAALGQSSGDLRPGTAAGEMGMGGMGGGGPPKKDTPIQALSNVQVGELLRQETLYLEERMMQSQDKAAAQAFDPAKASAAISVRFNYSISVPYSAPPASLTTSRTEPPPREKKGAAAEGAPASDEKKAGGGAYEKLTLDGAQTDQVWAHPSSLLSDTADPADGFYAFGERTEGAEGRPFVRDLTSVSALGLLVFGAKPHELSVEKVKQSGRVELPAGFGVRCAPTVAMLLKLLRRELDRVLTARVARPAAPLDDRAKAVCDLLAGLLARGH